MLRVGSVTSLRTHCEVCRVDPAEGAVLPDRKFLKQSVLPGARGHGPRCGEQVKNPRAQGRGCAYLFVLRQKYTDELAPKRLGPLKVYPTFYPERSTGCLKAFQSQPGVGGEVHRTGLRRRVSRVSMHLIVSSSCTSLTQHYDRGDQKERRNYSSFISFKWFHARSLSNLPSLCEPTSYHGDHFNVPNISRSISLWPTSIYDVK